MKRLNLISILLSTNYQYCECLIMVIYHILYVLVIFRIKDFFELIGIYQLTNEDSFYFKILNNNQP